MQYSSRFTIATHILLAIHAFSGQQKVTSDFLADSVNTNPVIIRKLLGMLQKAALVEVRPGTGGAFLRRSPNEITLLDVFLAVETDEPVFHFHEDPEPRCPIGRNIHAVLDSTLDDVRQAMRRELAAVTLQTLIDRLERAEKK